MKCLFICAVCLCAQLALAQPLQTPYERDSQRTATYTECIAFYQALARQHPQRVQLLTYGSTDVGLPLHLVVISRDGIRTPAQAAGRVVLLINNAIHPGEPEGVDASMLLARQLATQAESALGSVVVCIIPMYNIDGALRQGQWATRANQDGPQNMGFRGNARNLDLNRDFIKLDSRNARTFVEIFHTWQPHIFVDNHTSDGADYPYTMTLLATCNAKQQPALGAFTKNELLPALYQGMRNKKDEMSPYVNPLHETPDSGLVEFYEGPRFSSGFATLFNSIALVPETHMLKPFAQRLRSNYNLLLAVVETANSHFKGIVVKVHTANFLTQDTSYSSRQYTYIERNGDTTKATGKFNMGTLYREHPLRWRLDKTKWDSLRFRGYTARYRPSAVTGQPRLYYDHSAPYEKYIRYYNHYVPERSVVKPYAYVIPQAWTEVLDRLRWNRVEMKQLLRDTTLLAEVYTISDYKTTQRPYEGHYLHSQTSVRRDTLRVPVRAGDYVVVLNQLANRYLIETMEPEADDSFFNWGFFDSILMQKEYFSEYVFEDVAKRLLMNDPKLRADFDARKKNDAAFAQNAAAQLDYIYRRSPYMEPTLNRYPVLRLNQAVALPLH